MAKKQYILHSNIAFLPPRKPGRTLAYPINPMHGDIVVADWKYQNNAYEYHLVKNMNSSLKKILIADIDEQWIKGVNYMVMGYANKSFVNLMGCMYLRYAQITQGDLVWNQ